MNTTAAPGLTIGLAWNGVGELDECLHAAAAAPFVTEVLMSPMTAAVAETALAAARRLFGGNGGTDTGKLRLLPPGDSGLYSAWNKLIAGCTTSHMVFHGADDIVAPDPALTPVIAALAPDAMLVAAARFATPQGAPTAVYHHREATPPALSLGRHANPACPEVCWPVAVLRAVGGVDAGFRIAGDVDLYFRVRPLVTRHDIDTVLVTMRDGGMSVAARHSLTVWRENRRIARTYGQAVPLNNRLVSGGFLIGRHLLYRLGGAAFADRLTDRMRALVGKPPRYALMHPP